MQNASPVDGPFPVHRATRLLRDIQETTKAFELYVGRELSVNPTDLEAMEQLIMHGPLSPTQIAAKLGISTAAATVAVDRLCAVGHVTRAPNPKDRRGVLVVPEVASLERAMATLMPMIMGIDRVISEFSADEQDAITRYLTRVDQVYRDRIMS